MLGDVPRVQLGAAVDVGAVALDDNRDLHPSTSLGMTLRLSKGHCWSVSSRDVGSPLSSSVRRGDRLLSIRLARRVDRLVDAALERCCRRSRPAGRRRPRRSRARPPSPSSSPLPASLADCGGPAGQPGDPVPRRPRRRRRRRRPPASLAGPCAWGVVRRSVAGVRDRRGFRAAAEASASGSARSLARRRDRDRRSRCCGPGHDRVALGSLGRPEPGAGR